jgi:GT2 family glycosyltransferase
MSAERPGVCSDLTVVVPTVGRSLLKGCLESIVVGTVWPAELIVVDQSSSADVKALVEVLRTRGLEVLVVQSKERGIAAATNRGLERVQTDFVATTHDDCRVRNNWLETLSHRVREIGDAVLTGRVQPEGEGIVLTVITSDKPAIYTEPLTDGDVLFPPNMAFPKSLLDRVGYFDEHPSLWFAGEDNEWAYRLLRSRVPIIYDPDVVVCHVAWQQASELTALYRRYARGQGSFYGKYLRRADLFIARRALRDLARGPWLLGRGLVTRNHKLIAMGRGEVMGILPGLISGLRRPRDD